MASALPSLNNTFTRPLRIRRTPGVHRWHVPGFESLELLRGQRVTQEYPRHWHENLYLCATLRGTSVLYCRGASWQTRPGSLALVAPGEIHSNRKAHCNFRCVFVEPQALRHATEQLIERSIHEISFRSGLIDDRLTSQTFLQAHRSLEQGDACLDQSHLAMSFLHRLAVRHAAPAIPSLRLGNESCAVRQARRFLDEHYAERVSLQQLATYARLSPYHLHRSFCRYVGMPPHQYQLELRIMKAKSFLRIGRSISETASIVGFVDQSHLTRHFKRSVGVTPGQFLQ